MKFSILNLNRSVIGKFLVPCLLVSLLSACLSNFDDMGPQADIAHVSIYHGSPDAPELDIFAEANRINQNPLAFSQVFPYQRFYATERRLRFSPHNALNTLLETNQKFEKDKVYSVFLVNPVTSMEAIVVEDKWSPPTTEKSMVRILHLSPDAGELVIRVNGNQNPFGDEIAYKEYTDFVALDKGKISIEVLDKQSGEQVQVVQDIQIRGDRVYSLIVRGFRDEANGPNRLSLQLVTNFINS